MTRISEGAEAASFWIWHMVSQNNSSEATAWKLPISGVNDPQKHRGQLLGRKMQKIDRKIMV